MQNGQKEKKTQGKRMSHTCLRRPPFPGTTHTNATRGMHACKHMHIYARMYAQSEARTHVELGHGEGGEEGESARARARERERGGARLHIIHQPYSCGVVIALEHCARAVAFDAQHQNVSMCTFKELRNIAGAHRPLSGLCLPGLVRVEHFPSRKKDDATNILGSCRPTIIISEETMHTSSIMREPALGCKNLYGSHSRNIAAQNLILLTCYIECLSVTNDSRNRTDNNMHKEDPRKINPKGTTQIQALG
jgi:hypothetical protein